MNNELVDKLEALLAKATPGPWIVAHDQYFTMDEKRLMVELVNNAKEIIEAFRKP